MTGKDLANALTEFGSGYLSASQKKKEENRDEARWQAEFKASMERLAIEKDRYSRESLKMIKELDDAAKERKQKAYKDYWNLVLKENVPPAAAKQMTSDMHDVVVEIPDDVAAQTKFDMDVAKFADAGEEAYQRQMGMFAAYGDSGIPLPGKGRGGSSDKPSIGSEAERMAAYNVFKERAQDFLTGKYKANPEESALFAESVNFYKTQGDNPKPVFTSDEIAKMAPLLSEDRILALKQGQSPTPAELGIYKEIAGGTRLGNLAMYTAENYGADKAQKLFTGALPVEDVKSLTTEFSSKENMERLNTAKKTYDEFVSMYGTKMPDGQFVTTTIPGIAGEIPQVPPEYTPRLLQLRENLATAGEALIPTAPQTQQAVEQQRKVAERNKIQSTLSAEPNRQAVSPWAASAASLWMDTTGAAAKRIGSQIKPIIDNPLVNPIKETGNQVGGELADWTKGLFDAASNPDVGYTGYIKQKIAEGPGFTPMTSPNPGYEFTPNPLEKALEEFTHKFGAKK